jgi:hypothetical protein
MTMSTLLLRIATLATIAIVASSGFSTQRLMAKVMEKPGEPGPSCQQTCTAQPDGLGSLFSWRVTFGCPAGTGVCDGPSTTCGSPNIGAAVFMPCHVPVGW